MTLEEFKEKITAIDIFRDSTNNKKFIHTLWRTCKIISYKARDYIIKEGETGNDMYIGLSGAVTVTQFTRAGDSYTIAYLDFANGCVVFGEMALIDDEERSATVIAEKQSSFFRISQKEFNKLCEMYPKEGLYIFRNITKRLTKSLRQSTRNMVLLFDTLIKEIEH